MRSRSHVVEAQREATRVARAPRGGPDRRLRSAATARAAAAAAPSDRGTGVRARPASANPYAPVS